MGKGKQASKAPGSQISQESGSVSEDLQGDAVVLAADALDAIRARALGNLDMSGSEDDIDYDDYGNEGFDDDAIEEDIVEDKDGNHCLNVTNFDFSMLPQPTRSAINEQDDDDDDGLWPDGENEGENEGQAEDLHDKHESFDDNDYSMSNFEDLAEDEAPAGAGKELASASEMISVNTERVSTPVEMQSSSATPHVATSRPNSQNRGLVRPPGIPATPVSVMEPQACEMQWSSQEATSPISSGKRTTPKPQIRSVNRPGSHRGLRPGSTRGSRQIC